MLAAFLNPLVLSIKHSTLSVFFFSLTFFFLLASLFELTGAALAEKYEKDDE